MNRKEGWGLGCVVWRKRMPEGGEKGQTHEHVNCSVTQEWTWGDANTAAGGLKSGPKTCEKSPA